MWWTCSCHHADILPIGVSKFALSSSLRSCFCFFFRIWLSFFPSQIHLHPPTKTDMEPEGIALWKGWNIDPNTKHQHFLGFHSKVFLGGFTPQTWGILLLMAEIRRLPVEVGSLSVYPMIYEVLNYIPGGCFLSPDFWTINRLDPSFRAPHFFNPSESSVDRPPWRLLVEVFGYWSDYRWGPHVDRRWGIRSTGGCWVDEQKKSLGKQKIPGRCGQLKYLLFVSFSHFSPRKFGGRFFNILTIIFFKGFETTN